MKADLVEVIEACYRPATSDAAWLEEILRAIRPALGDDLGVMGHFMDASDPTRPKAWSPLGIDCPKGGVETLVQVFESWPPEIIDRVFRRPRSGITASQSVGRKVWDQLPAHAHWFFPLGIRDSIGVVCSDVTHKGCVLMGPLGRVRSVPRRRTLQLQRLAVHVATGLRLRRRLDTDPTPAGSSVSLEGAEAILHPDGRTVHAEPAAKSVAARATLRAFAKAVDHARGATRRSDPDEAIRLWEGLAAGRWSVFDHFDSDGRRFLVAHRNDPEVASPNALNLRERQVAGSAAMGHANKFIAYELGLSVSTIATHLGSAMMKLGVRSRADLVRLFGALVGR